MHNALIGTFYIQKEEVNGSIVARSCVIILIDVKLVIDDWSIFILFHSYCVLGTLL